MSRFMATFAVIVATTILKFTSFAEPVHAVAQEGPPAIVSTIHSDDRDAWPASLKKYRSKKEEFQAARREMRIAELNRLWTIIEPLRKIAPDKLQEVAEGREVVTLGDQTIKAGYSKPLAMMITSKESRQFLEDVLKDADVVKVMVKPIVRFPEAKPIMTGITAAKVKEMNGVYCGFFLEVEHLDHLLLCGFREDGAEVHLLLQTPSITLGSQLTEKDVQNKLNVWRNTFISAFFKYDTASDKAIYQPVILVEP